MACSSSSTISAPRRRISDDPQPVKTAFFHLADACHVGRRCTGAVGRLRQQGEPAYTPKELRSFDETSSLDSQWRRNVGDGFGRARYPIAPAREGDTVFAADANGLVAAFDADSGEREWQIELDTPISSALYAVAGQVYLALATAK